VGIPFTKVLKEEIKKRINYGGIIIISKYATSYFKGDMCRKAGTGVSAN